MNYGQHGRHEQHGQHEQHSRPGDRRPWEVRVGAKTALLAWGRNPHAALRDGLTAQPGTAHEVAARALPGARLTAVGSLPLAEALLPPDGMVYAASFPGVDLVCCADVAAGLAAQPETLPDHLRPGPGQRLYVHHMSSVTDSFYASVRTGGAEERGVLAVLEQGAWEEGERRDFELPYWRGERPPWDGYEGPPPFHPLHLGEAYLLHDFGFTAESAPQLPPAPLDPFTISVYGFRVGQ
ncbi:DUF6928 family protein [Streptomyces sp. NPDC048172]|uniref:DUF6928 family protein n=1 Tax=Streptomyces sp. NPDC048172 TaxID=3365505 RepID=UPI0037135705